MIVVVVVMKLRSKRVLTYDEDSALGTDDSVSQSTSLVKSMFLCPLTSSSAPNADVDVEAAVVATNKKSECEDLPSVDSDDERDSGEFPFQDLMVDMEVLQEHVVELRNITKAQMKKYKAGGKVSKKTIQDIYEKSAEAGQELEGVYFKLDKLITDSHDIGYLIERGYPRYKKGCFTIMPK